MTVKGRNNTEITTSTEYVNGEVSATVDALNNRTTYTRQYATSGEVTTYTETVTNPDNSTRVTISVNGEQTDISGTAVHPQSYEYGANWQRTLPQNTTAYSDLLGRQYRTVYADSSEAVQYYNVKSQVVKSVTPAGRVTLYEYDTLGRQTTQAIDMNVNDAIDAADIVTTTAYSYATYGGKTVSVTTTTRSQGADAKVISINRRSLDGLESWSTDMAGLTTHALLERLGSGATRQTVTQPTGAKTVTVTQNGRISTVTTLAANDTVHSEVNYTYDEFNRVSATEEKDADNNTINTTAMTYDAAGQILTQTTNGQTTSSAYDVANRTVTTTQPGNRVIVQESYPTGELKRISGADTYTQEWTWNATWGQKATLTTWKDANTPQVTTWTYNNRGFNTVKQYADNNGPTYTYDADGLMLTRTWARGVTTTYAYDNAGRQTSQSYSDGTLSVINNYNYLNQIPTLTDAAGTWNFTYNTAGKLASVTNPAILNSVVNYTYDSYARQTVMELTRGGTTQTQATYDYDSLGRIATLGNGSDTLSYAYRAGMNQLLTAQWRDSQNVALNGRSYEYDAHRRLTEIKLDGVREVAYTLNDKDQRTETILTNGDNWAYIYDTLGQLTGALKKDTQNNTLNSMSYAFDLIGNRTTATEDAANWTYASNLLNQYTQVNALVTTYAYDAAGRQTGYSYSDGVTPTVSLTLNYLDQTTVIADAAGTRNFTYNVNYRLANETNPVIVNGVMNYTYDAYGRRTGMNLTDGTVRAQAGYTYDTAGRIATVGDGGDTLTYAYAPGSGRVASSAWTTATGNNTAYTYDSYHRLTGIAVNNTPVYGYTLNDKNQRTAATLENGDNWAYTYDTLGQLTGALKKDSQDNTLNNMSYAFDLIGNRTTTTEDAANWTYASNLLNQYTQVNALLPTYDADGNMLTWNGWTYTWNGENRLVVAENDDTKVEMSYDYMGRRFEKKVYTKGLLNLYTWTLQKHRKFAYDGYKLVAEFDAMNNDALLANYLWQPVGLDVPLRATIDGDACYFIADGNKNIIALKDATGATTDDYTYTPFGAVTASGSTDNPFRFSSEYYDAETGLVYYNYRYYSPTLGRWIKRDPMEENGGMNLYAIVNNNSVGQWDNLGLWGRSYFGFTSTHAEITEDAFSTLKIGSSDIKYTVRNNVTYWNLWTDSGPFYSEQEYHYCRKTDSDIDVAKDAYRYTLRARRRFFSDYVGKALKEKKQKFETKPCVDALAELGIITHMLQDYYAHGVEQDDESGHIVGKLRGSPDNPQMVPVSFGAYGFTGSHGGFGRLVNPGSRIEPGDRATDQNARKKAAIAKTKAELIQRLNEWLKPCNCVYERMQ